MKRVLVFANPIAGQGRGAAAARGLSEELGKQGWQAELLLSPAHTLQLSPEACREIRAAIVVGGDGTLRGVAEWAIDSSRAEGEACVPYPLLLVPTGTANLMGQHLGIAWETPLLAGQVIDALERGNVVHLDVARTAGGIFLLMAGIGFDAWVVHEVDRLRRGPIHMAHYAMPILRGLAEYPFPEIEVEVDGRVVFQNAPGVALVGNVPEYGLGFPVLVHARSDDQLLDVCVMPCASRGELMKLLLAAAANEHLQHEGVVYVKGRHVEVRSAEPVAVQTDGEPAGHTPLVIDLLPGRIPFIVPRSP